MNMSCNFTNETGNTPLVTIYCTVLIIGVPANFLTLFLTMMQIKKKNVMAVYLFTLSVSDLLYMATIPQWIRYVMNNHKWQDSELACKITGFIFFNNLYVSILILCCISVDRYVAVVYSLESRGQRRQKKAWAICIITWLLVVISHIPVFTLKEDNDKGSCFETFPMTNMVARLSCARFCIGFFIPLITLIATNIKMFLIVKASGSLTDRQKSKVRFLTISVIAIFLFCFAPYHCLLLGRAAVSFLSYEVSCAFEKKIHFLSTVFICLCTVNSAINPILYVFTSENCRHDLRRGLRCLRNPSNHSSRSETITLRRSQN
ncbi:probable G-protein coupled receptor 132 [Callorhinchus milii]|uniref:probable G-protein coupled receptor 132 n=1 Tax=Callorhinchus milii TaxID=7868 RepID=UPI0004572BE6|nr:probable G-protein coupled receptor 132 [Callorhinchus milii]XP_007905035.1 probable G-protein coupled receptor 132 [Callorhinchus milii]|eukprot:gi/632976877/ref/XP_007905034.1/ PREDICTED: probable G-protein coupled receptor 132 [Callorhinchus milii]